MQRSISNRQRSTGRTELARRSGIPETTLSKIINHQSVLDVEQAGAIAHAFTLELWELTIPTSAVDRRSRTRQRRRPPDPPPSRVQGSPPDEP